MIFDQWVQQGNRLCEMGEYQEALEAYETALSLDIENAPLWNNKAFALYHLGRYQDALESCDIALSIDPNYGMAWNNKGDVLGIIGKYEEAIDCYNRALIINPNNKEILASKDRTQSALIKSKSVSKLRSHLKVKDLMTPNPIVIPGTSTIAEVEKVFKQHRIWSVYVGERNNFVGVITKQDLQYRGRNKSKSAPAFAIMSKGVFSIDENADVKDAEYILRQRKVNGIAVTKNGKHYGIITWWDIKNKRPSQNDYYPIPLKPISNPTHTEPQPIIAETESPTPSTTVTKKIIKLLKTSPNDRKIQKKIEKAKENLIQVDKKINQIRNEINRIEEFIKSLFDKAKKSHSDPETIFLAREIKHKQSLSKSKWDTIDKLQRIQHYYERIVDIGDLNVSLKDFGLDEFTPKEIEDFVIHTTINKKELIDKVEVFDSISSKLTESEAHDDELKEILAEIRSNKK